MAEINHGDTLPGDKDDVDLRSEPGDGDWLRLVKTAFDNSTDYLDQGIRGEWEASMARFQSQHPAGSKYHTEPYRRRSKIFRPKTRSAERRTGAMVAKALFSNSDLIDCRGQNTGSPVQAASARVNKELLQYRLEHSIPWFVTALGARQDAFNYGVCVSLSTWKYEQQVTKDYTPLFNDDGTPMIDEEGRELGEEVESVEVTTDKPVIDLIPPENLRFDQNADWRDVVGTSPTLTVMMSMHAYEVVERGEKPNPVTGAPEWRDYDLRTILTAHMDEYASDAVRAARLGAGRKDPMDPNMYNEYTPVWVHLNIVRKDGVDYAFYTLGTRLILSEPVPAKQLLPLGRESLTVGFAIIETHKTYPTSGNTLAAPLQSEINDTANQRMDNVRLALNKRYVVRRGANVDLAALSRSVPGGGIMAKDPEKDVRVLDFPEITGSSYQEQDRLAQEQDELMGMFSGSSVQANRSLNETVGGMNLLQGDAMSVAEMELRTWIETWVEPVLRKLQKLEAMFETDEAILAVAGENSGVFQQYGQDVAIDTLLDQELIVSVNVGMGNTDPMQRVQRFQAVLMAAAQIPEIAQRMKGDEVGKEMFALGGYSEGERFFLSDEEFQQRQQQMAEAQQGQQQPDHALEIENIRSQDRRYDTDVRRETEMEKVAANANIKLKELYEKIGIERDKTKTTRDVTALKEGNKSRELRLKARTGSGI